MTNIPGVVIKISLVEQRFFTNTIMKFVFDIQTFNLLFYIVKYQANPLASFFAIFQPKECTLYTSKSRLVITFL